MLTGRLERQWSIDCHINVHGFAFWQRQQVLEQWKCTSQSTLTHSLTLSLQQKHPWTINCNHLFYYSSRTLFVKLLRCFPVPLKYYTYVVIGFACCYYYNFMSVVNSINNSSLHHAKQLTDMIIFYVDKSVDN